MQIKSTFRQRVFSFLLFTSLLTGVVSCKKDKNENPTPAPPPATELIKEFKTGDEFIRFDYSAAGDVNKVTIKTDAPAGGATLDYTVTYAAGKKIASLETPGEKIVPVYENNLVTRADIFQDNERVGYTTYLYENNALKRATIYFGQENDFNPFLDFNFTYNAAGNVTETVALMANGEPGHLERSGHTTYQYDQKTNPLYAQKDLLALFWLAPSKNNITVQNEFDAAQQPEDKFVYNYTYNANGLPKSAVVTQGLPGQPNTTSNVTFTYK
ncbi:MAG: hypothetical protein ABI675_02195 [Chitinophagaceae bacterium]